MKIIFCFIYIYKAACLCVCHTCVRLPHTGRCSSPRKGIILWLFGPKLLGLIRGLSKNAVRHDDQLDETKIFVISKYFGKLFYCPKTCKTFSLIIKTLENLKSLRIVSHFSTHRQSLRDNKSHTTMIAPTRQRFFYISDFLFSHFCHTTFKQISKVINDFVKK